MPHRRDVTEDVEELTPEQRQELLDGVWLHGETWFSSFDSPEERRRAWRAADEDLLESYIAENPGSRPTAWWIIEGPGLRAAPYATVSDVPERWRGYEPEVANLDHLGVLRPDEERRLRERGPIWGGEAGD